jgi:hypothetical protein
MMELTCRKTPCPACPYRRDVPSGNHQREGGDGRASHQPRDRTAKVLGLYDAPPYGRGADGRAAWQSGYETALLDLGRGKLAPYALSLAQGETQSRQED